MEIDINKDYSVLCEYYSNYRNWGHKAHLFKNGVKIDTIKIVYCNRTWERYQFESVLVCFCI